MAEATDIEASEPFESASELRAANAGLLDLYDHALEKDASADGDIAALREIEAKARDFLKRGVATGAYIEETKERTGCQVLLDYWVSSLARVGAQLSGVRLARFDGARLPDLKDKPCPYVGLEAFRDNKFFFGRDADTQTLIALVRESPLVIVFGASGSGKSSLVMGGAVPALAASDNSPAFRIIPTFVPGNAVLANLADAVAQVCPGGADGAARLRIDGGALSSMLGGADAPPTLLVIDQFEELFTLSESAERDALVGNLAGLLDGAQGHRAILTMREEFRSRIVELEGLKKFIDRAWYPMRPMGYEELKAAVERPAALVNLQFQAGIVDDLVKRVLGQPAALPLLQFTLRSLWDQRDRNRITWEVYQKVGDPLSALKSSANRFYDGLAPQSQDEARRILLELVRVDDLLEAYRQPVPKSRLLQAGRANTETVLDLLAANDYVRIAAGKGGADAIVEVKHESLVRNWPRLVGWIDEKRIARRRRLALSEAAGRWEKSGKPNEGLLTGWQLEEAKLLPDLSALENEFISASGEAVENAVLEEKKAMLRKFEQEVKLARAVSSRRIVVIVAAILLPILVGTTSYFWDRTNKLTTREKVLERREKDLNDEANKIEKSRAEVDSRLKMLQEEYTQLYNKLFAGHVDRVANPEKGVLPKSRATVFLHISDQGQRPKANELARQFQADNIVVPGVEKVKPVSESNVRYFRDEDEKGAREITNLLIKYLGNGVKIASKRISGYEQKVPQRHFEVWFSSDAFRDPKVRSVDVLNQLTPTIVAKIFPSTPIETINSNLPALKDALHEYKVTDKDLVLIALALIRVENGDFQSGTVSASKFNTSPNGHPFDLWDNRRDLGNTGAPDGERFKGRGFIRLFGRANYVKYARAIGIAELVENPDLAAQPTVAAKILAYMVKEREARIREALAAGELEKVLRMFTGELSRFGLFRDSFAIGARALE